ncbi:integrase [Mycobacteroides abscessus subsp. massiliense]|uniref:site-specific integrase n=1 Tax=Mycobacteroides abscessus TaxID=36809 RepID=UPI0009A6901C|nr:site-specific integrase [Mycobacteroides abscessus]SKE69452.1 integrase [Mycobacteroides abscessus subsp. massiliense]SKH81382.1 integrase [Mycobacteroides abscessus subsp. massiliense]SKI34643.1 integrase [Mycobacteroides abscessus subsp. massiliense]SKJ35675.1 integrase [Mycobacteroides abscessus subsp. massiliense]SKK24105.1 integrase [Mycobacteroides abscessus subsp. massiliense]
MILPAVTAAAAPPDLPPDAVERIRLATIDSQSEGTRRAYSSAWRRFEGWCRRSGYEALPAHPATVAAYLVDAAETVTETGERAYSTQSLGKWTSAIFDRHRRAGVDPNPAGHELVRQTMSGIRRQYASRGDRPRMPRTPLLTDDVMLLVTTAREQATGWASQVCERRDSALLLMGFAGAFRRSELSALTGGDVELHAADGIHVHLRKSKTDQMGEGGVYPLPRTKDPLRCPACAFVRWAAVVSTFDCGGKDAVIRLVTDAPPFGSRHVCRSRAPKLAPRSPLFRSCRNGALSEGPLSGAGIHAVIRRRALRAGFEPEAVERLGGHSLRAGFVTQAARAGADHHAIMRQTGHRTPAMVTRYVRESAPLIGNAVTVLGL